MSAPQASLPPISTLNASPQQQQQQPGKKRKKPAADQDADKRAKTPRACDSCRRKKIRCEPLDPDAAGGAPTASTCKYCKNRGTECTWYLPITETRWKSKGGKPPTQAEMQKHRADSEAGDSASGPSTPMSRSLQPPHAQIPLQRPPSIISHALPSMSAPPSMSASPGNYEFPPLRTSIPPVNAPSTSVPPPSRTETRLLGPTSISHMLHDTVTFPAERFSGYMNRNLQKWEVKESSHSDGFVKIYQDLSRPTSNEAAPAMDHGVTSSTIEQLVNVYLGTHASLFPVLTRADFLTSTPLEPILLWTVIGVAAMSCKVPSYVLRSIKTNVSVVCRESDILTAASLQVVQAHLMMGISMELERGGVGTKTWNSVGTAIRMAQNLGLHRENDSDREVATDMHHVELRRRVWGGCIIADRWISAIFGLPLMIDLTDCDRLYPSEYEYLPGQPPDEVDLNFKPFLGNPAMIEISILLGDVLKLLYSPSGLNGVTDDQLNHTNSALDGWFSDLPHELQLTDPARVLPMAGFLAMFSVPVLFLFYRPFMNPNHNFSAQGIQFCVTQAMFAQLLERSSMVIHWCNTSDYVLESWSLGLYCLFICALIQYHQYVRNRDEDALRMLRMAGQTLSGIYNEECNARTRISEIVHILEHTAVSLQNASTRSTPAASLTAPTPHSRFTTAPTVNGQDFGWSVMSDASTGYHASQPVSTPVYMPTSMGPAGSSAPPFSGMPMQDPHLPFTFVPGSDFAAPGPQQGPLSFDPYLPSLAADQSHWQALVSGLEEASGRPVSQSGR